MQRSNFSNIANEYNYPKSINWLILSFIMSLLLFTWGVCLFGGFLCITQYYSKTKHKPAVKIQMNICVDQLFFLSLE